MLNVDTAEPIDLFEVGRRSFESCLQEFAAYGIVTDPRPELRRGQGMLCYYDFKDGNIYLALPDLAASTAKLHLLLLRSILNCPSNDELLRFLQLFIPCIIAHELAHHYRHRYGLFNFDNLWSEEQIANQLAIAVTKHRLTPEDKALARQFLTRALEKLSSQDESKNIATDSYYNMLYALSASGQINTIDADNIEWVQTLFAVQPEDILKGSGQLSEEVLERLEHREDVIESINAQYTSDYTRYFYYHIGWLYLALNNTETQYVEEFIRIHLNQQSDLLPTPTPLIDPDEALLRACFKASRDVASRSEVASRYFYKRYRALLLAKLQTIELPLPAQTEQLKRQASVLLETWNDRATDTLNYLAQLVPAQLRPLFPHVIDDQLDPQLDVAGHLPTSTDQRLWRHVMDKAPDEGAANTLNRLTLLEQIDLYRPLPVEALLELAHTLCRVRLAAGETIIWEGEVNDDVYILHTGQLAVTITEQGQPVQVGSIKAGQIFGEAAFFTQEPRMATVRAVEPSECFVLKDADLYVFVYKHPTVLMQMAGALARRVSALNRLNVNHGIH